MKINNKNMRVLYFVLILLITASCSEEYLDVDSKEEIAQEDSENVTPEEMVNGVYGMLTEFAYAFSYLGITEIISDNADKGSSSTDTGSDKDVLDALTFTSSAGSLIEMWDNWYKSINRATNAIEYAEDYGLTDEDYKDRLVGEAEFLRALNYFWLVRSFGAVPLQHIDLVERQPVADVYDFIEEDLLDAIDKLPLKSEYDSDDLGRVTKGAAQALLAKVYLYQEDWENAYDMADEVILSAEYSLHSDYAALWRATTENGVESIFEVQARGESIAHGVQQYSQTQGARGTDGWGWGYNIPSETLVNAYEAAGDEIRMNASIIFEGETLWDGREVFTVENPRYNEKAYSSASAGADESDKNIRILRYAEILLIKAEAASYLGEDAATPLNLVRTRVGLDAISNPTLEQIWEERHLELAMEHDRWFDLIRTGQAQEAMAADGKTFIVGKHELFPIPYNQLVQTPSMEQNPGWE
ncbi:MULTISPECIES: RagB/SusD family nutrient uptake outer membrane protein [Cellulophaga]|uniref:RagB/SusD family nutrient uptake outer membrane protein n=1 Tax=Cellulophaga TaxID=104264 RepID=UPI0020918CFC|nr:MULTISPECIES: RagB/SusD family nutrient uptake outer membrane protein [Cellulophaga]MDO6769237.1 RagB/SusD family nutrient uptake outer membrane protein [Cellulophaga sp. 1_MG-2023]